MLSGTLDVCIADIPDDTVYLTESGLGSESSGLGSIEDGSVVELVHGRERCLVTVRQREKSEIFSDLMELGADQARKLKLRHQRRYEWLYTLDKAALLLRPHPVSTCTAVFTGNRRLGKGFVSIGSELLAKLGMPDNKGMPVRIVYGSRAKTLKLYVPSNQLEHRFQLAPATLRFWGLVPGRTYRLRYNQQSGTLTVVPFFNAPLSESS
jgi:hypothetical protein